MKQSSLAETLRVLRARRDLTITDAARLIGITRETLRDLEHGTRNPYYPTLEKIAGAYGVSVEELMLPATEEEPASPKAESPPQSPFPDAKAGGTGLDNVIEKLRMFSRDELRQITYAVSEDGVPHLPEGVSPEDAYKFAEDELLLESRIPFARAWEALPYVSPMLVKEAEAWSARVRQLRMEREMRKGSAANSDTAS